MRRLVIFLAGAASVFGAAITSNGTGGGNWASSTTWSSGAVPGAGDTVTIANGDTVTIAAGTSVTVGSSPADDAGTAAIQCAAATGTGAVRVNGELIYRGPVRLCRDTIVGPGAKLTHDSSAAATPASTHYSWQQSQVNDLVSALRLNGASDNRISVKIAPGSGDSGGFQAGSTSVRDGGQLIGGYFDVSDCGVSGTNSFCMYAQLNGATSFDIDHATFVRSGKIGTGTLGGASVFRIRNSNFQSPLYDANFIMFQVMGSQWPPTTGSREISGNYFDGGILYFAIGLAGNGDKMHLLWRDNWVSAHLPQNSGALAAPFSAAAGVPDYDEGEWTNNLVWTSEDTGTITDSSMHRGVLQRTYMLQDTYAGGVLQCGVYNPHFVYDSKRVTVDSFVFEPHCLSDGTVNSHTGHAWLIQGGSTSEATNYPIILKNNLFLAASDGGTYASFNITGATTPGDPHIFFYNNTALARPWMAGACEVPVGGESGPSAAGTFQGVHSNIFYFPNWAGPGARSGCITTSYISSRMPTDGDFTGINGYNWLWNVTNSGAVSGATPLYHFGDTALFTTPPGTGDRSGDPGFSDPTRNFLKWCQTLNPADATRLDCKAHFALRGTADEDARYAIGALIDYVRAGFTPGAYAARYGAAPGNSVPYVGAVPPVGVGVFPMPGGFRR